MKLKSILTSVPLNTSRQLRNGQAWFLLLQCKSHEKAQEAVATLLVEEVEFAREKGMLFEKWSYACKATDFNSLRELILPEEFKRCLRDPIVVWCGGV